METILVVEDEKDISQMLCVFLESGGYRPVPAFDGVTGLQLFCQEAPDLIILDLLLPKLDGFSLCRAVREKSDVPVIMLTALSDEENQLKGYDLLADDYVTKPFSIGILLKKVEALLRRQRRAGKEIVSYKSVILDKDSYRVTVEGKEIFLTGKEFELLYLQVCRENDLKLLVQNYISFRQEEIPGFDQASYGMTWEEAQELWEPQDSGENSMIISGRSGEFILEMMDSGAGQCSFMAAFSDFGPYYFLFMIQEDFTTKAFLGRMIQILPFILLILLFFAAAASMAYARFISRPILQMARAAQAMSQLEWEKTGTEIRRKDEIGSLARSIRLTAENLEQVLKERDASNKKLQEELEYQKQLKQEQKVFFASASHDLKTPVTVLKGQLTGMLYRVGVYQDRDKYLKKVCDAG